MSFSACTTALVKKPMKPSFEPCFFSNTSLYCVRIAMMWVMSTSLKVVSIAAVFCTSFSRRAMVWRSRRGSGLGRRSRGRLGAASRAHIDLPEQRADGNRLAVLGRDLAEHTGGWRRHYDRDLVGFELDQRLVHRDGVASLLEPAADGGFRHGLAERRNTNFSHDIFPQLPPRSSS